MTSLVIKTRGVGDAHRLLDGVADRLDSVDPIELLPGVLEIQEEWWGSLGAGTWDGHDLEVTGGLRAAATEEGADGSRVEVDGDTLVFGLASGGPGEPGFYGAVLAGRGWSAIVDPDDADAQDLAERYATELVGRDRRG